MLDLIEGAKIVMGLAPTTASIVESEWINTENMHCVWAIVTKSLSKGSSQYISAEAGDNYAGTGAANVAAKYWKSTNPNFTRFTASTASTGVMAGATAFNAVVVRYDPSVADTSQNYFSVALTSGWGCAVTYICEPRYGGAAPTAGGIATSST